MGTRLPPLAALGGSGGLAALPDSLVRGEGGGLGSSDRAFAAAAAYPAFAPRLPAGAGGGGATTAPGALPAGAGGGAGALSSHARVAGGGGGTLAAAAGTVAFGSEAFRSGAKTAADEELDGAPFDDVVAAVPAGSLTIFECLFSLAILAAARIASFSAIALAGSIAPGSCPGKYVRLSTPTRISRGGCRTEGNDVEEPAISGPAARGGET